MENEKQMLMGNIARIILSDDVEEIENMRAWAHKRIDDMANYKIQKISEN
ncbi:hypothetical protein [Paenibacillus lactis]